MVPTSLRATNAQIALAIALFNLPLHVEKGDSQVKIRPTLFSCLLFSSLAEKPECQY